MILEPKKINSLTVSIIPHLFAIKRRWGKEHSIPGRGVGVTGPAGWGRPDAQPVLPAFWGWVMAECSMGKLGESPGPYCFYWVPRIWRKVWSWGPPLGDAPSGV